MLHSKIRALSNEMAKFLIGYDAGLTNDHMV